MATPIATRSSCSIRERSARPAAPACRRWVPSTVPNDEKVYIDLDFYQELKNRFHVQGDFAQAYVIAHEVGHHVQKLLGIMDQVEAVRQRMSETQANALQVRVELQADCFAGIFANHAQESKNIIEPGDIDEALNAASAIGDDKIQKQTQGYVVPDAFTHGSSAQRQRWFKRGYESGKLEELRYLQHRSALGGTFLGRATCAGREPSRPARLCGAPARA